MVRQRTSGEGSRKEEKQRVLPHAQRERRQEEGEEMEGESWSKIVLVAVLQRHLPRKVHVTLERARSRSTHALNALGAQVVAIRHPHAVAHHDTSKHAHNQNHGQVSLLGLVHERSQVQIGEKRLEGQVNKPENSQKLVHWVVTLVNPDVLHRLQRLHQRKISHANPTSHGTLPHVHRRPQDEGKRRSDRLCEAHLFFF